MKKKFVYGLMLGLTLAFPSKVFASTGLTNHSPSVEELRDYWYSYETESPDKVDYYGVKMADPNKSSYYEEYPDISQKNPGKLSKAAQEDAIHTVNFFRKNVGLEEVDLSPTKSYYAQAGAFITYAGGGKLNHRPGLPKGFSQNDQVYRDGYEGCSSSNISTEDFAPEMIRACMLDWGASNRIVGHRRWILYPRAKTFGMGIAPRASALYVFNNSGEDSGFSQNRVFAYPAENTFVEFTDRLSGSTRFSVIFESNRYGEGYDLSAASIEVTDLNDGSVYQYNQNQGNLVVDTSGRGSNFVLVFGENLSTDLGDKYQVKVNGVKSPAGAAYPVDYTINFSSLEKENVQDGEDHKSDQVKDNNITDEELEELKSSYKDLRVSKTSLKNLEKFAPDLVNRNRRSYETLLVNINYRIDKTGAALEKLYDSDLNKILLDGLDVDSEKGKIKGSIINLEVSKKSLENLNAIAGNIVKKNQAQYNQLMNNLDRRLQKSEEALASLK